MVYIAWAQRSLSNDDLELLRHVYEHHKRTGKPVFFVLTQIDKAMDFDPASGKAVWEDVRDANNEFLQKYFRDINTDKPDMGFIGEGFTPVSAAFEAKSRYFAMLNRDESARLILESRMSTLRREFDDYLKSTSGPTHLVELTVELQKLLTRLTQDIQARESVETTPRTELQSTMRGYKERRSVLIEGKKTLRTQLDDLGAAAIQRAFGGSDPDDLASILEERLKPKILSKEILKAEVAHEIETEKIAIVREWIARDRKALIPRWEKAWDSFVEQSNERAEKLLASSLKAQQEASEENESQEADLASVRAVRPPVFEPVAGKTLKVAFDALSKAWQTYVVVASVGSVGAAASATPALAALGPIGWALIAAAFIGGGTAKWKLGQERKSRRDKMIEDFPRFAREVVETYRTQANEFVSPRISQIIEFVDNEIERLKNSMDALEQRQQSGEYLNSEKRIRMLGELLKRCADADRRIAEHYAEAARLQPQLASAISGDYQSASQENK